MSGGIESMHEDEGRGRSPKPGNGKARTLEELFMFYTWAREQPIEKRADLALELCHQLMIELSNHVYDLHGQRT